MLELLVQIVLSVVIVITTCVIFLKLYVECIKGRCTSNVNLTGKTALVTGANTGIGYWTALDFAQRNARVILACRDLTKGQTAIDKLVAVSGNTNVVVRQLDLSSMKSVCQFAERYVMEEDRLDILVNNAGAAGMPLSRTEDGVELMFATNYLGHFLLTNLLIDVLKKCRPSRVVNVSSLAHAWTKKGIEFAILKSDEPFSQAEANKSTNIAESYFSSKLANILFTRELASRMEGTGVTTYCLHPGPVNTKLLYDAFNPILKPFHFIIAEYFVKTCEEGAQTSIYCAVSEELNGVSGKYYMDCKEADKQSSRMSRDLDLAKRLWDVSEQLTGLGKKQ